MCFDLVILMIVILMARFNFNVDFNDINSVDWTRKRRNGTYSSIVPSFLDAIFHGTSALFADVARTNFK